MCPHQYYFAFQDVGPDFRADLGFVPQAGYRYYDSGYLRRWQHDDPSHWYNNVLVWGGYEYTDDREGNMRLQPFFSETSHSDDSRVAETSGIRW